MVPNDGNSLMYRSKDYGPYFGNHDLYIGDQCHINRTSVSKFPSAYNLEGGNKYKQGLETYRKFSGSQDTYFKVIEY